MCFYQFKVPSEWAQLYAMTMKFDEIMDDMAHEFLLVKVKRELDQVNDPESLRRACLLLIDLLEKQKATFKKMLYRLIEDDPEAQELFE